MKTADLIQMVALGVVGYLAWQKFGPAKGSAPPAPSSAPSNSGTSILPDFGLSNPNAGWGDDSTTPAVLTTGTGPGTPAPTTLPSAGQDYTNTGLMAPLATASDASTAYDILFGS
jgi:hypothetical protein